MKKANAVKMVQTELPFGRKMLNSSSSSSSSSSATAAKQFDNRMGSQVSKTFRNKEDEHDEDYVDDDDDDDDEEQGDDGTYAGDNDDTVFTPVAVQLFLNNSQENPKSHLSRPRITRRPGDRASKGAGVGKHILGKRKREPTTITPEQRLKEDQFSSMKFLRPAPNKTSIECTLCGGIVSNAPFVIKNHLKSQKHNDAVQGGLLQNEIQISIDNHVE